MIENRLDKKAIIVLALALISALVLLSAVEVKAEEAKGDSEIITLPWDNPAKKPVPPPFVLPKQNRWGCLACHSNKKLSKIKGGREISMFIDAGTLGDSVHKNIACIDCHTNFSYEDHPAESPKDFRQVAGQSCMKCHPFQAYQYRNSVHGELALQNKLGVIDGKEAEPALCSSCHGAHDIQSPRFEPYRSKFRASSQQMCGTCHADRFASYSDHYHGAAYKRGAKDSATCWDCHGDHRVLKGKDPGSTVSEGNLRATCGKCHDNPGEGFIAYAPLIHNRSAAYGNNPVFKLLSIFIPAKTPTVAELEERKPEARSEVVTEPKKETLFSQIFDFFFPKSLRPLSSD
jgi:hypothetical protein